MAEPSARRFPQSEQRSFPKGTAGGRQQAAQRAGGGEGARGLWVPQLPSRGAASGSPDIPQAFGETDWVTVEILQKVRSYFHRTGTSPGKRCRLVPGPSHRHPRGWPSQPRPSGPGPCGESGPLLLGCETNTDRTPSSEDQSEPLSSTPIVDLALGEELHTNYWSILKG